MKNTLLIIAAILCAIIFATLLILMMRELKIKMSRDIPAGIFAVFFFLGILPCFFGNLPNLVYFSFFRESMAWWIWFPLGGIGSALVARKSFGNFYTLIDKQYIIEHWIDPWFGGVTLRGKGFHFRFFWEVLDATTEHERDITIVIGETDKTTGKVEKEIFETIIGGRSNLYINGARLTLQIPINLARELRAMGSDMDSIRKEIDTQLRPTLVQVMRIVIANKTRDQVQLNEDGSGVPISTQILKGFREQISHENGGKACENVYGCIPFSFSLGQVDYSKELQGAREQAAAMGMRIEAAKKLREDSAEDNGNKMTLERAMEFVHGHEDKGSLKVTKTHFTVGGDAEVLEKLGEATIQIATALEQLGITKKKGK